MDAGIVVPYRGIAQAYAHLGLGDKARQTIADAIARAPRAGEDQELKADRGLILALSGRRQEAVAIVRELEERHRHTREELAGNIAAIYAGLGETNAAFKWLQDALAVRDPELAFIKVDPRWDAIRNDARFDAIIAALALNPSPK